MPEDLRIDEKIIAGMRLLQNECPESQGGFSAQEISSKLGYERSYISNILNRLAEHGTVIKKAGHPTLFLFPVSVNKVDDPFQSIIGREGSLKNIIDICKASVVYPPCGLSLLISGASGTGKNFLANCIYRYAIFKGLISHTAPFMIVNCSEYANNPELLSAHLFGYNKGAFTGANVDKEGVLELANGGYLFLDEVHRLSPENQEKLFRFLDYGEFKRLGDSDSVRKASVRFIYATSEQPKNFLLTTLLRRISLTIALPDFVLRPKIERIRYISSFFSSESRRLDKDLLIEVNLFNNLANSSLMGNIGELKNIIQHYCALAWEKQGQKSALSINYRIVNHPNLERREIDIEERYLSIGKNTEQIAFISADFNSEHLNLQLIKNILEAVLYENESISSLASIFIDEKHINYSMLTGDLSLNVRSELFQSHCEMVLQQYGLNISQDKLRYVFHILNNYLIKMENDEKQMQDSVWSLLCKINGGLCYIAERIIKLTFSSESNLGLSLITALFFINNFHERSMQCTAIIVAHGVSTAKSIAGFANQIYNKFIYHYLDMPLSVSPNQISEEIKNYIDNFSCNREVIILVDMGSLYELRMPLINFMTNNFGMINNISTSVALEVAEYISDNMSIKDIVEKIRTSGGIKSEFYQRENKDKVILISLLNAYELSNRIMKIISDSLTGSSVKIISVAYEELVCEGYSHHLFQEYDVKFVITNSDLTFLNTHILMLDEIINGIDNGILDQVFHEITDRQKIDIKQSLMQSLSMDNLSDKLTILNPRKIVADVNDVLNEIETSLIINLSARVKITLFLHLSMMIERVLLNKYDSDDNFSFDDGHSNLVSVIKNALMKLNDRYNIIIPEYEIKYILRIMDMHG